MNNSNHLWDKYGLSNNAGVWVEQPAGHWQLRHYSTVPHDLVCRYLEEHPIAQRLYQAHAVGYWYLDILERAETEYNSGQRTTGYTIETEQDRDPRGDNFVAGVSFVPWPFTGTRS